GKEVARGSPGDVGRSRQPFDTSTTAGWCGAVADTVLVGQGKVTEGNGGNEEGDERTHYAGHKSLKRFGRVWDSVPTLLKQGINGMRENKSQLRYGSTGVFLVDAFGWLVMGESGRGLPQSKNLAELASVCDGLGFGVVPFQLGFGTVMKTVFVLIAQGD